MADNQYLSRYARHETRFSRVDPTPWIPLEDEEDRPTYFEVILGAVVLILVLSGLVFLAVL